MQIQYGYLALFAPAYPLAPLLALINNVFAIRIDAVKFCNVLQRPVYRKTEDIGSWYAVLNVLGFAAVVVNATMICFVGAQLANPDELGGPDTTAYDAENACPRYINPEIPREMCSGIELRIYSQRLWVYTMIIEHGVMLMRVVIGSLSPENPEWIEYDKDTLNYRVEQWENGMEDMQREGCSLEQIHDAMNSVYANKLKAIQEKKTFM